MLLCQSSTYQTAEMLASYSSSAKVLDITTLSGTQATTNVATNHEIPTQDLPAFLLYTSGSSGTPKGMWLRQAGFINYLASKSARLSLRREVVLQQSSLSFDMSIAQIFNALANGGTVVMAPQSARGDPVELSRLMLKEKVSFTLATPSEYLMLIRYGQEHLIQYSAWRNACSGGESVTQQLKRAFCTLDQNTPTVTDCYGPTEISAATCFETVSFAIADPREPPNQPAVGKAIPNTSIYILDDSGKPVPTGFPGEIAVGGVGVARGYLQGEEPKRTRKFIHNTFAPEDYTKNGWTTMYKTGDKGFLSDDGSLVFLGRLEGDRQVKLRGLRIDLDDIARNLLQAGGDLITDAAVSVREDPQILVAHVIPVPGKNPSDTELMQLSTKLALPQYMRPAIVCALDRLPMSTNGKVDWKAIDSLDVSKPTMTDPQLDQFSLTEGEIRLIFDNVLRGIGRGACPSIAPDSDFFALGGNSHLLVRLQGAIKEAMNVHVTLRELYQNTTVRAVAAMVLKQKKEQPAEEPIDWDRETDVPADLVTALGVAHPERDVLPKAHNVEVLLTGSTSFLGSVILETLVRSPTVSRVHCVAIPPEDRGRVPESEKVVAYSGSLYHATLGVSKTECDALEACVDIIVHAGASGHCLNGFSSLRVPNLHSTQFLARLAVAASRAGRGPIPLHFVSSNRVTLLSGKTAATPTSMAAYRPSPDGSEGFTAAKWASERFLEKLMAAREPFSQLQFTIHRPCAVVGETAPSEDALNALVRYSRLMGAVPKFGANVEGFFDFKDVHAVASDVVAEVLGKAADASVGDTHSALRYKHHSSGLKVPVQRARAHMESRDGVPFDELRMDDWLVRARQLGLDALIVSYLEAVTDQDKVLRFPYMGTAEGEE
jgi:acyl-coenzyme A synthetase/AMP-(fatty) acid ligase/thioester reductase-like protein